MSAPRKVPVPCGECGELIEKATRIEDGNFYCLRCYGKYFIRKPCSVCNGSARVLPSDRKPICRKCRIRTRRCFRCGRPVPKAGMLFEGFSVCPVCVPHFKERKKCPLCNRESISLAAAPDKGISEPVCERCRGAYKKATCVRCRRHRKVSSYDDNGRPLCNACSGDVPATHVCPGCKTETPGGGTGKCRSCLILALVEKRKAFSVELLEKPWSRELFIAYCRRLITGKLNPKVPSKVVPAAVFFAELDQTFADVGDITADALLANFEPEHLRRNSSVVSFLAEGLNLNFTVAGIVKADGRRRLKAVKESQANALWGKALEDYEKFLRRENRKKPLSDRTVSSYLRVAAALFASAGKEKSEEIVEKDIATFVQFAPGSAASLTAFIGYLRKEIGPTLQNPEMRGSSPGKLEKRLIDSVRNSLETLITTNSIPEAKAHLARLISRLYGYRLKDVLGVRKSDVQITPELIVLKVLPDEEPQKISGEVLEIALPWIERILEGNSANPFLFEGRLARRPMDSTGLVYHKAG